MKRQAPAAPGKQGTPVGIKDIARRLGISIGTVDRALHDKRGISVATRARVLAMAESLGYRPNLAARFLKSGTAFRISVHLPREIALFWDSLREGIREAAAPFAPALQVEFRSYPGLGEGDIPLFEQALQRGVHGLIVAPGDPHALAPWIHRAALQKAAVACVVTDAPETERLTFVSADPFTVGAVAGELMARFLPGGRHVAFFTGWLGTQDHAEKLRGFNGSLGMLAGQLTLAATVEAHDDERAAYRQAVRLLKANPGLDGIYVSTVNSLPVLRAIESQGRLGRIAVIATDLFPALVPWIRRGAVAATVYQRPVRQGSLALHALYKFLVDGTTPPARIKVVPHVVMRSNLDLVLERLQTAAENDDSAEVQTPPITGPPDRHCHSAPPRRGRLA
ncbi:MAG TPA: substrate-binding domain-containing protein [Vicinamibacterales bacterium]|jgi:LacI family transcriptional regulator